MTGHQFISYSGADARDFAFQLHDTLEAGPPHVPAWLDKRDIKARPFRAISLTDNVPVLTAIANDYGYDEIFLKQLEVLMSPGDVVVAISVSGNSPNVLRAVEYAQAHGATTVALTGFDGGKLRPLAQLGVHVPTTRGEYGPAEDVHMILDHLVSACLMSPGSEEGDET